MHSAPANPPHIPVLGGEQTPDSHSSSEPQSPVALQVVPMSPQPLLAPPEPAEAPEPPEEEPPDPPDDDPLEPPDEAAA